MTDVGAEAQGGSATGGGAAAGGDAVPNAEELRAAYEQQIKQIRVEDLILENVVTLLNLGMRRTGLSPGTEDERDPAQVRMAIESVRSLLPLLEQSAPGDASPDYLRQIKDALSQLQMAFVKIGGQPTEAPAEPGEPSEGTPPAQAEPLRAPEEGSEEPKPGEAGPAQRSGRLWVPGQ
ncbi:MAG: hypothetical protein ACJ764_10525 [Solirubrobacteraceae bacterium]